MGDEMIVAELSREEALQTALRETCRELCRIKSEKAQLVEALEVTQWEPDGSCGYCRGSLGPEHEKGCKIGDILTAAKGGGA